MSTTTANGATLATANVAEIRRALCIIMQPGQVTELRAVEAGFGKRDRPAVISGYYDDADRLAQDAARIAFAAGVYFIPNEVNPALLARAVNTCRVAGKLPTTSDKDIARRLWLLVDCDAARPAGISASDEEHAAALAKALDVLGGLAAEGWPPPIYADSGNGGHLMYRIDLPAEDGKLIERCLEAFAARWSDAAVKVDTTVGNPARIWKLYGTVAGKGDSAAAALGRPQRLARIIDAPAALEVVSREQLESLAAEVKPQPQTPPPRRDYQGPAFDLDGFIARNLPDAIGPKSWDGGPRLWVLPTCPWDSSHTNHAAFVGEKASGPIVAGCKHDSCKGREWRDLRELFEPRDQRQAKAKPTSTPRWEHDADCGEPPSASGNSSKTDSPNGHAKPMPEAVDVGGIVYERITSRQLDEETEAPRYIIEGVLPAAQAGVIGGLFKTLKTTNGVDLAMSAATGRAFLNKFPVVQAVRAGIMSAESGRPTLMEIGRRVAASKGMKLADCENLSGLRPARRWATPCTARC